MVLGYTSANWAGSLASLGPSCASFYILCPIPGTEQYDDFLAEGLITERNLDRFDTTCLTWQHPHLSAEELQSLLFTCYRRMFSAGHLLQNLRDLKPRRRGWRGLASGVARTLAMTAFNRYSAWNRVHPMSGGMRRVRLDRAADYARLRRSAYDLDLAPLPNSLHLSAQEGQLQALSSYQTADEPLPA